jgi:large subunit ribosomal protein L19
MNILMDVQELAVKKVPDLRPGLTVRVHQRIKEGEKERIQIFEGLVTKINSGHGADKTFTVRKVVEGIGVEKSFPVYSTNITKIEIKKNSKVRRSKLYYMRDRSGKSAKLRETLIGENEEAVEAPKAPEEAPKEVAEEKAPEEAPKEEK